MDEHLVRELLERHVKKVTDPSMADKVIEFKFLDLKFKSVNSVNVNDNSFSWFEFVAVMQPIDYSLASEVGKHSDDDDCHG